MDDVIRAVRKHAEEAGRLAEGYVSEAGLKGAYATEARNFLTRLCAFCHGRGRLVVTAVDLVAMGVSHGRLRRYLNLSRAFFKFLKAVR